ncbi:hypothetical protein OTK49_03390 [Vibrio coralliirubri]|uniref:hypothetical protein n=1 Tax=Vibrio coralliirubri TaxID=1516159 RepID=UPI002283B82A|nr:hypothetical protein [Vibrio coralliirubri]MCY9861561.1 hypothetical protein [Vibrio coralliirubri]
MFVLHPANKELFEAQIKQIVNAMWVNEFSEISNAPDGTDSNTRRNRFGLRGNRYLNVIADLYGYESYSKLISMANPTSSESPWVNDHAAFSNEDGLLHSKVLQAASLRCSSSLVGCQRFLADSFVGIASQLYGSKSPMELPQPDELSGYPFIQLMNSLPDVHILRERKDEVFPEFLNEDEIKEDSTPYYSLYDSNDNVAISPCFNSLDEMSSFFKDHLPLYSKFTIDVSPSVDEKVFKKVGDLSGFIWNS